METATPTPTPRKRPAAPAIKVECLECGRKFTTRKDIPECPKCGGVDVDVREDA